MPEQSTTAIPMTPEEIAKSVGGTIKDEWEQGEEIKGGWVKLKVGESVKGTLVGKKFQKSNKPGFKDQWVYEILVNGAVINIGFSIDKNFINNKLRNVVVGQIVMIKRKEDAPSKMFPGKKANSYDARLFGIDPDYKEGASDEEETVNPDPSFV
jgi:hypothetical protein